MASSGRNSISTKPAMSPENRTKRKDSKEIVKDRQSRKRLQNRISQQCVREKQVVYSKQVEALASLIKSTTNTEHDSTVAKTAHLNMQMALIEENRELRDALLRMRKKMLSLSSAVGAVADDPIFEQLLNKPRSKGKNTSKKFATGFSDDEEVTEERRGRLFDEKSLIEKLGSENAAPQGSRSSPKRQQVPPTASKLTEEPLESSHNSANVTISSQRNASINPMRLTSLPSAEHRNFPSMDSISYPSARPPMDLDGMTLIEMNAHESPVSVSSASSTEPFSSSSDCGKAAFGFFQPHRNQTQNESMQADFSVVLNEFCYADMAGYTPWAGLPSADAHYLSGFEFVPENLGYKRSEFHVAGDNSWKIERASLCYIGQHLNIRGLDSTIHDLHSKDVSNYDALRTAIPGLDFGDVVITDVAKLAVDIMCKTSGFSQYIYGVGANRDMEKVFQWRLSPSTRNRLLVPEPFTPTPLQYMRNCNYPSAIDFINWPSIRDQLIFKAGSYDIDRVVADIVANTVIEIPERRVAINTHDTFFTKIFSLTAVAAHSTNALRPGNMSFEECVSEAWEATTAGQATLGWTSADVYYYIKQQIEALNKSRMTSPDTMTFDNCHPSSSNNGPSLGRMQPLASKWGLDKLYRWKLSKEFAQAYPFLDCTGVMASFPMFASRNMPDP